MKYSDAIERDRKRFYASLSEKDRRAYAAVEVAQLGHGGIEYIAPVLGWDPKPIGRGRRDLDPPPVLPAGKVRHAGGGRKNNHPGAAEPGGSVC